MEGGINSSHVSFLHRGDLGSDPLFKGAKGNQYNLSDMKPHFEVVEQPGGLFIGARRNAENGNYYWRITPWVMPCFTMIPPRGDHPIHGHFWVPIDDENCWAWTYDFHPVRALTKTEVDAMKDGAGVHCKYVPGTYRPLANKDNDYLIDRAAQKAGKTFSGVAGFAMQDASLQESMGPICDRTKENLVSTDNGIIMARHRLMRAVKALVEKGSRRPASILRTTRSAPARWCCRRTWRSRTAPRRRSTPSSAWRRRRCRIELIRNNACPRTTIRGWMPVFRTDHAPYDARAIIARKQLRPSLIAASSFRRPFLPGDEALADGARQAVHAENRRPIRRRNKGPG